MKYDEIRKEIKEFINDSNQMTLEIDWEPGNKLCKLVNPFKLNYRRLIFWIQYMIVPCNFKNWLLKTCGMDIGHDVCMAHYLHIDPYFPELIKIKKGTIIGGLSNFITHKIEDNKLKLGRINIGERCLVAGYTELHQGINIGNLAMTGAVSVISKDVPDRGFVIKKDKLLKTWSDEEIEKYFATSKNDPNYYKDFKQKMKDFAKSDDLKIRIEYNGKRLNAADDWYKARNYFRIVYNSFVVESAKYFPGNGLKKFILRTFMGTKIGKNVKLGKKVTFDHFYGDRHIIGDNVKIGDRSYLDGHSYTISESIFGGVRIGDNTIIGKDVSVMCGIEIGKNCHVLDNSIVIKNIPDGETWGGIPAKKIEENNENK